MNLRAGTEVFYQPPGAAPSPRTVRYRGVVRAVADRAVVLRCAHAHRKSMAAHKCAVKLLNEEWGRVGAATRAANAGEPNPLD